jgi:hypothetical protein
MGYQIVWGNMSHGIPCCTGYHAAAPRRVRLQIARHVAEAAAALPAVNGRLSAPARDLLKTAFDLSFRVYRFAATSDHLLESAVQALADRIATSSLQT